MFYYTPAFTITPSSELGLPTDRETPLNPTLVQGAVSHVYNFSYNYKLIQTDFITTQ